MARWAGRFRASEPASLLWTCIIVALPGLLCQSGAWSPSDFPNPQVDTGKCGRQGVRSFLCDPDGVLPYDKANVVEGVIADIEEGRSPYAVAPCGSLGNQGYQVAVALMRRMKLRSGESAADGAARFARALHDAWGVGHSECNNGVLLLLALDDRQVFISTGRGARSALPDARAAVLIERMKPALREGDYPLAVERAVREIGLTLAGADFKPPRGDWLGTFIFGGVLATFAGVLVQGIRSSIRRRREYGAATALLEKLKREQRAAMAAQRFPERSCPICMDDFAPQHLQGGASRAHDEPGGSGGVSDDDEGGASNPLLHTSSKGAGSSSSSAAAADALGGADWKGAKLEGKGGGDVAGGSSSAGGSGEGRVPLVLPCGHVFCEPCIERWAGEHSTCPICRQPLVSPDEPRPQPPPPREQPPRDARPHRPAPRSRYPRFQRCWSDAAYMDEFEFRLRQMQRRYPYYITDPLIWSLRDQAMRGQEIDWEHVLRREMANQAERQRLQARGQSGARVSFGGGNSSGGGGAGGSW